jgi:hypothetical protein
LIAQSESLAQIAENIEKSCKLNLTGKHFNIMADYDGSVTITTTTCNTTHLLELIQENKSKGLIRQVGGGEFGFVHNCMESLS